MLQSGSAHVSAAVRRILGHQHFVAFSLAILLSYATIITFYEASVRPFWFDEIFTVALARLDSMSSVWNALARASDTSGPGYYMLQRAASKVVTDEHVAQRLASIVAVPIVSFCLFSFAKRHVGPVSALIAGVMPLHTVLYHGFSVEARPYAAAVCSLAVAMLAWQRAASAWWLAVLAGNLAAAVSFNYYAVFALAPFALAEIVGSLVHRRFRIRVWCALLAGLAPLVTFWPQMRELLRHYGPHYWSRPSLAETLTTYDWYFRIGPGAEGTAVGLAFVLCLTLLLQATISSRDGSGAILNEPLVPAGEAALAIGFICLPFVTWLVATVLGGGATIRYSLAGILGLALGVSYASHALGRHAKAFMLTVLLAALGSREVMWGRDVIGGHRERRQIDRHERMLAKTGESGLPVVVSNGLDFVPLAYYRSDNASPTLVTLIDAEAARYHAGTDSLDLDLEILRRYLPLQIYDFREFTSRHDDFLLYSSPGRHDWWPAQLLSEQYSLRVIATDARLTLYRVSRSRVGQAPISGTNLESER